MSTRIAIHISTIGPLSLPKPICSAAIGYNHTNNLIWLIGGWNLEGRSLISFNLSIWNNTNAFLDYGYSLSYPVTSNSQSYVQTEAVVFVVEYPGNKLLAYDMLTENVTLVNTNPSSVEIAIDACLALIEDWIIYVYLNHTYILTMSNQSWKLSGNPIMSERRRGHACIVEPDGGYLYVIGGFVLETGLMDSILKLYVKDITNIQEYSFTTLTNTLSRRTSNMAAALYKTDIYVAGGLWRDQIDVIDTKTDSVMLWGRLCEELPYASTIVVGDRLYIFGGGNSLDASGHWQYFDLFSIYNMYLIHRYFYIFLHIHVYECTYQYQISGLLARSRIIICVYIHIIYDFERCIISSISTDSPSTNPSDTFTSNSSFILPSSSPTTSASHPSREPTIIPTVDPISPIQSQSPSQYPTTSTAPTETPILSAAVKDSYPTNAPSTLKHENQTNLLIIIMIVLLVISLIIILFIYKMVRRKYIIMNEVAQFMRDNKNKENHDNEYIKNNDTKGKIEINDTDKNAELDDVSHHQIGDGPVIIRTGSIPRMNKNIDNLGGECVQSNHKKRNIAISNVVKDHHEADDSKDDVLYGDYNHIKGQQSDLRRVSKNFERGKMTKQQNGEFAGWRKF